MPLFAITRRVVFLTNTTKDVPVFYNWLAASEITDKVKWIVKSRNTRVFVDWQSSHPFISLIWKTRCLSQ